ncbi:DsbA family protein [uncultured Ferrovibrio sp.]|jgi:protein-disulfide isomerase|uniref:DsbA family protein n=1 Tax=uncultured Ferrovibrio sp. TaxID=1576913 RepID=UPI002636B8A9|nr:DsbA family protein [uncultured Ferrovibrio sp.]
MKYIQRFVFALTLCLAILGLGSAAQAQASDPRLQDMVLGKADAPVTIVEYASLTCPHCANFHSSILPELKKEFIETGKVKLVFRDFPLDQLAFAGAIVARCGGPERYFTYLDVLFAQQRQWATAQDPMGALKQIARLGGMSSEQVDTCFADKTLGDYILNQRLEGNQKFNVNSTPTLIINGKTEPGVPSWEELRNKLNALAK